jgi:integrase
MEGDKSKKMHCHTERHQERRNPRCSSFKHGNQSPQWKNRGIGTSKVFSITPTRLRKDWEVAGTAAGIPDIRLHDLRHEAASRLFEKGLNVMEAASVTGHKTLSMLNRYTHLNPTDIAKKLG